MKLEWFFVEKNEIVCSQYESFNDVNNNRDQMPQQNFFDWYLNEYSNIFLSWDGWESRGPRILGKFWGQKRRIIGHSLIFNL